MGRYRRAPLTEKRPLHRPPVKSEVEPLVSVREAAVRLGVPVGTLRDRIVKGKVPVMRIGRSVRLRMGDVRNDSE